MPIPVTLITGFLGSGKTTLVNAVLRFARGRRVAVVVNEFGEIGIDGATLSGAERFIELANGCVCCVLNDDLERGLVDLVAAGPFDHMIVETTGLADPLPVAWTFGRPSVASAYRLDAIVGLVGALEHERIRTIPEARIQIERADLLLITKRDAAPDGGEAAAVWARSLNARAPVMDGDFALGTWQNLPWELLLASDSPTQIFMSRPHLPAHSAFESFVYSCDRPLSDSRLEAMLEGLPSNILRAKGIVQTDESARVLVNAVGGRVDMRALPEPGPVGQLVFIGERLDRDRLRAACANLGTDL